MDNIALAASVLGASQQLTQQQIGIAVMKSALQAERMVVDLLAAVATEPPLRTSGSIGTNINTTA